MSCLYYLYLIYLVLGNIPRIIIFLPLKNGQNFMEFLLYVFSLIYLVFLSFRSKDFCFFGILGKFVLTYFIVYYMPFCINFVMNGEISSIALSYNLRILLIFISSAVIGYIFYIRKMTLIQVLDDLLKVCLFWLIVAWVIFFIFPKMNIFWFFLEGFGIHFKGDPHIRRLVGTLFDPNFLGNELIFFFFVASFLYIIKKEAYYLLLSLLILTSMVFTFSRSTWLGFFLVIVILLCKKLISMRYRINIQAVFLVMWSFLISLISLMFFFPVIERKLIERMKNISHDPSAHHRFHDFHEALKLTFSSLKNIIIGIGYNSIPVKGYTKLTSFDSSILTTLLCNGVVFSIFLLGAIIIFLLSIYKKLTRFQLLLEKDFFESVLVPYLISSLVICNFNNLLYYQFYILLILPLACYLWFLGCEKKRKI